MTSFANDEVLSMDANERDDTCAEAKAVNDNTFQHSKNREKTKELFGTSAVVRSGAKKSLGQRSPSASTTNMQSVAWEVSGLYGTRARVQVALCLLILVLNSITCRINIVGVYRQSACQ